MHCACVYENKQQYDKAHQILTATLKNALEKNHFTKEQFEAFAALQLKITEKERYFSYYIRKEISMTFDAMTTSPVESMNSHMKKFYNVNGKNSISRSVQIMTEGADERVDNILKKNQRELQMSVIGSKLPDAHLFSRKCVFMLHYQFDIRKKHKCAMIADHSWLVWNFEVPSFERDKYGLEESFPRFLNVFQVNLVAIGNQSFLQCDCRLYTRCGIPCCHVFKVTDTLSREMIAIQHWKAFPVYYGSDNSNLSKSLMRKVMWQESNECSGTPISSSIKKHCYRMLSGILSSEIKYPILCDDLTSLDYRKANYVVSTKNTVTMKQLNEHFSLVAQEVGETST
jgi:hypothetical protein